MNQDRNYHEQLAYKVSALNALKTKYEAVISSDETICNHLEQLSQSLPASDIFAASTCEKLINYVLAEIYEPALDEQRMEDESPALRERVLAQRDQQYFRFKNAIEEFYLCHLKHSPIAV